MVCAYLVYSGLSVDEALQLYANRRTINNQGVCAFHLLVSSKILVVFARQILVAGMTSAFRLYINGNGMETCIIYNNYARANACCINLFLRLSKRSNYTWCD